MLELDNIKLQTTWNDAAQSINSNFAKILIELAKGGQEGSVPSSYLADAAVVNRILTILKSDGSAVVFPDSLDESKEYTDQKIAELEAASFFELSEDGLEVRIKNALGLISDGDAEFQNLLVRDLLKVDSIVSGSGSGISVDDSIRFNGTAVFAMLLTALGGIVADTIKSSNFQQATGFGGSGYGIFPVDGGHELDIDFLKVRKKAEFYELVIQQMKHQGGMVIYSAAALECSKTEIVSDGYKCFFDTKEGSVPNEFVVGDFARCQRFDLGATSSKYYWRYVREIGDDYIVLSKSDCDTGSDSPAEGDVIVQLGNRFDMDRQQAMIISVIGANSPRIDFHEGINSYSLDGKLVTVIGMYDPDGGTNYRMGVYTKHGRFDGEIIIGSGSSGLENFDEWGSKQTLIDSAQATAEQAQADATKALEEARSAFSLIAELNDDTLLTPSEKAIIRTDWATINGTDSLSASGISGTYYRTRQKFIELNLEDGTVFSYNGKVYTYNINSVQSILSYKVTGLSKLDAAYLELRDYLYLIRLNDDYNTTTNFSRYQLTRLLANYYDAETQTSLNYSETGILQGMKANEELTAWASDSVISPVEKTGLRQQKKNIEAEYAQLVADAKLYNISTTSFAASYNKAITALTKYTSVTPANITIESDYADISAYYTAREALVTAIDKAKIADAQAKANDAEEAAKEYTDDKIDTINEALASFATDNQIDASEKRILSEILSDEMQSKVDISARAATYSNVSAVTAALSEYNTAYNEFARVINYYIGKDGNTTISSEYPLSSIDTFYKKRAALISALDLATKNDIDSSTQTKIDGGLITSGSIQLYGGSSVSADDVKVGMTAKDDGDTAVRIWAGATMANRRSAPFRVLQNGKFYSADAEIHGKVIAGEEGGSRIEVLPDSQEIKGYDENGKKVISISGNDYDAKAYIPSYSTKTLTNTPMQSAFTAKTADESVTLTAFTVSEGERIKITAATFRGYLSGSGSTAEMKLVLYRYTSASNQTLEDSTTIISLDVTSISSYNPNSNTGTILKYLTPGYYKLCREITVSGTAYLSWNINMYSAPSLLKTNIFRNGLSVTQNTENYFHVYSDGAGNLVYKAVIGGVKQPITLYDASITDTESTTAATSSSIITKKTVYAQPSEPIIIRKTTTVGQYDILIPFGLGWDCDTEYKFRPRITNAVGNIGASFCTTYLGKYYNGFSINRKNNSGEAAYGSFDIEILAY